MLRSRRTIHSSWRTYSGETLNWDFLFGLLPTNGVGVFVIFCLLPEFASNFTVRPWFFVRRRRWFAAILCSVRRICYTGETFAQYVAEADGKSLGHMRLMCSWS